MQSISKSAKSFINIFVDNTWYLFITASNFISNWKCIPQVL